MRERQRSAALEALVLFVIHLERAHNYVPVLEGLVLAREIGVVKSGDAVMVVHEVVIELAVGVVRKSVIGVDDGLVIVENLERFSIERLAQALERRRRPLLQ